MFRQIQKSVGPAIGVTQPYQLTYSRGYFVVYALLAVLGLSLLAI